ncbi:MAG TPA: hypothetical protein VJ842_09165 [Pyrinomonadaceae bacterium]|nr:hypothetical protein [Pyrinomonadaceae bacterium]
MSPSDNNLVARFGRLIRRAPISTKFPNVMLARRRARYVTARFGVGRQIFKREKRRQLHP